MRRQRRAAVATLAAMSGCLVLATQAPMVASAVATGVKGDVSITNTETVDAKLSATGRVSSQRIYDQLVVSGDGTVDIENPVSTDGLRNLNGFGGPSVRDGKQRISTSVKGEKAYRSVADYDGELPVDVRVEYRLDGEKVEPGEVVGKDGILEVTYSVRNMTGKQQEVTYTDGEGNEKTRAMSVVVPLVGSMSTVLPSNFTDVQSEQANAAGDGKGGTLLSFTMTLFPPIGSDRTTFGYTAEITDGIIPEANMSVLPVNPLESPSFSGGAASYKGGAESGVDLTEGAAKIDQNLLKIRDGAEELVAGILQLDDGAGQLRSGTGELSAGANKLSGGAGELNSGAQRLNAGAGQLAGGAGELNTGAQQLKAGAKQLAGGAGELNTGAQKLDAGAGRVAGGAGELANGLGEAQSKAPALLDGVAQLRTGVTKLDGGLAQAQLALRPGTTSEGGPTLMSGVDQLLAGMTAPFDPNPGATPGLSASLGTAYTLIDGLYQGAVAASPDPANDPTVLRLGQARAIIDGSKNGVDSRIVPGLERLKGGLSTLDSRIGPSADPGVETLRGGTARLGAGLNELAAGGNDLVTGLGKLKTGADMLNGGASQLAAGTRDLSAGTDRLSSGANELAGGTGKLAAGAAVLAPGATKLAEGAVRLAAGTGELAPGAVRLAQGAGKLDEGAGKLADGLDQAAQSAPALPEGAQQLSDQGTSQLVNVGNSTAMSYGEKYALIEAGAERASQLQPYGSPEGATSRTAYKLTLSAEDGEDRANMLRVGAAAAVALLGLGGLALRRRLR
ncbi:hypothetical protein BHE97_14635 [Aeromicrobium sp. PE09-221]|uniref:hypothetical protein n=1 Tax=Aeromicrobium sp. PE09-221 TaxID=1898043 RepID=UPI000B3EA36B|nr:hypothetical protein [Aeromicrobium sp. PE09-221]OUZ07937.1 hypothetical protein BHE97_14635 [Aeromicrobium sp. PE09-221]